MFGGLWIDLIRLEVYLLLYYDVGHNTQRVH